MQALDILKQARGMRLEDQDGRVEELRLLPGLTEQELKDLEASLPCPLPEEAREVFSYTRGFEGILEQVDFVGLQDAFGMEDIFPHAIPLAHDGYGNFWIVDLTSTSTSWGPIFFACHDAPVIVFQTDSFAHFLSEVLRFGNPPWKSEIDDVHEQYQSRIWRDNPGTMTCEQCLNSGDADLATFARSLDETYLFIDLRHPKIGNGFSWGRYGPRTVNQRFGEKRIFAYQTRKSFWQRLWRK
jgi:cell wall assembly regulator SMI1